MIKLIYKNQKNNTSGYTLFKLNCNHYCQASYEKVINPYSQLESADELVIKLNKLIIVYKLYL